MSHPSPRTAWLLAGLTIVMAFSGCLGDKDAPGPGPATNPDDNPSPDVDTEAPDDGDKTYEDYQEQEKKDEGPTERVPEAHYHHYWGNPALPRVTIFEGDVQLDFDACFDSQVPQDPPCMGPEPHMGSTTFDLEDDGDDIPEGSREGKTDDGKADTVFVGTESIVAEFSWEDKLLGDQLLLFYRAANSPIYQPQEGIPITLADPRTTIDLGKGMADPAHQIYVSRWSFMLVADSGPQEDWQLPIYMANGTVSVTMQAINGGKDRIDPPHPDHWNGAESLGLGTSDGSFSVTSVAVRDAPTAPGVPNLAHAIAEGDGFEDIAMPIKSIVPTGSDQLVVTAWVNRTDAAAGTEAPVDWGLKYHGANDLQYLKATDVTDGPDGSKVFTIEVAPESVDGPYERESYWRFGIYPIANGEPDIGTLEGTYAFQFEVHRQPDFTYYF